MDDARVTPEPTRRVFFALWPDEDLRALFVHATHKEVRHSGGRPVPAHNLHITLMFLGSVPESRIGGVEEIGARAAAAVSAAADSRSTADLVLDRIEVWEKARVLVAAASALSGPGHRLADALAGALRKEAIGAGFVPDHKPFRAHITLARKVGGRESSLPIRPVIWNFARFSLVESQTEPDGPVYTVLRTFLLESRIRP